MHPVATSDRSNHTRGLALVNCPLDDRIDPSQRCVIEPIRSHRVQVTCQAAFATREAQASLAPRSQAVVCISAGL